ncbi:zinc chelation protein SecC [Methanobacterium sp.]|uniref:zinc chelation protein SecC n=1 Tax=Methanobacterium sp. TaxID=2164 RepID=UPI0025E8C832|nr:zinc chelation protein SecC [Methanobacterium sp.]MBI5458998.1 zinc chelation protein SecC [Methanobacterium sp.]
MSNKKIKDNPSFVEMRKQMNGIKTLKAIHDFTSMFGLTTPEISEAFSALPDFSEYESLFETPDQFNEHFVKLGWVAHDSMSVEVMKNAVDLAEKGDLDKAEELLVEYYDEDNLKLQLIKLNGVPEFRIRMDLILNAKMDYLEGRYHACIPVVLMMMDGVVADIEQKGFFADGTDLEAWDSIAGHSSGLAMLKETLFKTRRKTTAEEIDIPYRNGILHGRDLGYANRKLAAKCWAALFSVNDMILSRRKKHEEKPKVTLKNIMNQYAETKRLKESLIRWEPRKLVVNADFPESGKPEDYDKDSPERATVEFLDYWMRENFGLMVNKVPFIYLDGKTHGKLAGEFRKAFDGQKLINYKILDVIDEAAAISEVNLELEIQTTDGILSDKTTFRLCFEEKNGKIMIRGEDGGSWKIVFGYQKFFN